MSSSHSSPNPSLSVSFCEGFSTVLQLSHASPWRSLSLFFWSTLGTSQQLSWERQSLPYRFTKWVYKSECSLLWSPTSTLIMPSLSASSSQASPVPSPSASSWPEFGTNTQLSWKQHNTQKWFLIPQLIKCYRVQRMAISTFIQLLSLHWRLLSGYESMSVSFPHTRPLPAQPTPH